MDRINTPTTLIERTSRWEGLSADGATLDPLYNYSPDGVGRDFEQFSQARLRFVEA